MTKTFVQLVVENLLKVLKTQVFHNLYFLDFCFFARVCTFRARARIVIIDCLPYYSGSPPRRGARRKGGRKLICGPPLFFLTVFSGRFFWCLLFWGNLSFARKGLVSFVCVEWVHVWHDWYSLVVLFEVSCYVFGCFTSLFYRVFGCFASSRKACT